MSSEQTAVGQWRPDTYWDGRGQGNPFDDCTRGLAAAPVGIVPEALPPHEDGEVEIVLIKMRSTTGDLMSLRVRRDGDAYVYRMVNEYELDQVVVPVQSTRPLSFHELTVLLWSFRWDECDGPELVGYWEYKHGEGREDFDSIREWFVFESEYYEGLNAWHDERFEQWKASKPAWQQAEGG